MSECRYLATGDVVEHLAGKVIAALSGRVAADNVRIAGLYILIDPDVTAGIVNPPDATINNPLPFVVKNKKALLERLFVL